jgi:general secretion pathway protein G
MAVPATGTEVAVERWDLLDHLSRDPILVLVMDGEDLAAGYDGMLDLFAGLGGRMDAEQVRANMTGFDERLGCSLRDDLLAGFGENFAFVLDLPPIDELMASMTTPDAAAASILGRTGMVATVGNRPRFDGCLRRLFGLREGVEIDDRDELVRIRFPDAPDRQDAPLRGASLYYGFRDDLFALGADPVWVAASLAARAGGERLRDGTDFSRVFAHLDASPDRLSYVNLPKIREMVRSSAMLQAAIASDGEARGWVDLFLSDEFAAMGIGSTAVDVDGGSRRMSFGPTALSSGTAVLGMIAATAVPNLINATDRGKQKRTMADIRSAGTAAEMYAIDNNVYPSTESHWVPLQQIESTLSPVYIHRLPTVDGWGHSLMYWSDGEGYRIASPGKDGEMSRDWSGEATPGPTDTLDADIVMADGRFVTWAEGQQR